MLTFLKSLHGLLRRRPAPRNPSRRPRVEALEDRLALHSCSVQFSSAVYLADASARFAVVEADRVNVPEGAISVRVTARAPRGFKPVSRVLSWGDNDSTPRFVLIPLRHARTVRLKLGDFNGTTPGSPTRAMLLVQG